MLNVFTHFPIYSPWRTVSQLWHFKHHTCHCRSRATKAWPSRNWFPQPAQAPGSEGPSPDPLVAELFPIGVEASRTGIPTHRWQRAWPIDNALLIEIGQIRSTIRIRSALSSFIRETNHRSRIFAADSSSQRAIPTACKKGEAFALVHSLFLFSSRINNQTDSSFADRYDRSISHGNR